MAKKIEVYDGEINEFVDWVTGINEVTEENVTDGKAVSGKSIRDLLHNRLKAPIYFYYDENNSLYRLFASKEAYKTWLTDEEKYASLELGNFVAPSPFTATLTGLSEETKYVRYGDNQNTSLAFRWNIEGKNQSNYSDSVTITYSFNNNGIQTIPVKYSHAQQNVTFDMEPYLTVGTNTVTVTMLGDTTNATTSIAFNVEVLDLSLSSTFSIFNPVESTDRRLDIAYTVQGSGTYGRTVDFYLDGNQTNAYQEHINSNEYTYSGVKQIPVKLETGKHTLQIISYITVNNINYYSNLLYFEFVVTGFTDLTKQIITIGRSFDKHSSIFTANEPIKFTGTQYEDFVLNWGFYTSDVFHTSQPVEWRAYCKNLQGEWEENSITTITAKQNTRTSNMFYAPVYYGQQYLRAYINGNLVQEYELYVYLNANNIAETEGFIFKLSAKGRSNTEPVAKRSLWMYTYDDLINDPITYTSEFHNFLWNQNSGWYDNALTLSNGATADIHINPLSVATIGNLEADNTSGFAYEIEFETFNIDDPNEVIIWFGDLNGASVRITPNSAYITNSTGTLRLKTNFKEGERVKLVFILNASNSADKRLLYIVNNGILERGILVPGESFNADGEIHIDGTHTGIKVHSMRLYNKAINYNEAFANYVLDSGDITRLLTKNNVYDGNGNISESLCEQKLDTILITGALDSLITAKDKRTEIKVDIERICLADPKYSFKIVNGRIRRHGQSTLGYPVPNFKIWSDSYDDSVMYDNKGAVIYKGRYAFKEGAIPCKKWVLQANYADSSGVHNGGLQRLIQDSWYNSTVDKNPVLRTPPQNFAASTGEYAGKGWKEAMKTNFPYLIRVSPDSFPCVVFWRADEASAYLFLGQYVFMDDKKSDYVYGERSIYNKADDPFRLKGDAPKKSLMECLWDNKDVLQIEILSVNTPYVNYTTTDGWNNKLTVSTVDSARSWMLNWENHFELIYPEPDDIYNVGEDNPKNIEDESILIAKVLPFTDWIQWLVDCHKDYLATGTYNKFKQEAEQHIDLYKLAAYYIFVLRFGLVDSLQRNALIKTYDGQHFWYEPWDMDIALGNKNTGGIAFDPPIDRDTQDPDNPGTYWISGKNGIKGSSGFTSCFLWDALEAWKTVTDPETGAVVKGWIDNIVPAVSNALYASGLTYNNVMKMFDEEYAEKWCERMYNDSGHYKYVENGEGGYLQYLQGARTSHRHWWTKVSFDYWDAKWASGDFRKNAVTIVTNTTTTGLNIKIVPSTSTYYSFFNVSNQTIESTSDLTLKNVPVSFTMDRVLSTKDPRSIFGSVYIKELDVSEIALYMERLDLSGLYDKNTGTNVETLNIGMPWNDMVNGKFNYKNVLVTDYSNLSKLSTLYVRGYRNVKAFNSLVTPLHNLQNFYAAGSGITLFLASDIGNLFKHIELPSTIQEISLKDSSWQDLKFYHVNVEEGTHMEGSGEYEDEEKTIEIMIEVPNTRLDPTPLTGCPEGLNKVEFLGNTGQNDCTREFVLTWVKQLKETDSFAGKTLVIEDANWASINGQGGISYADLMDIGQIENLELKGYIKLNDKNPTSDQLSNIMSRFGEGVFSLGSADLTIDYEQNAIVISAPWPCYTVEGDTETVYLKEGAYYNAKGELKDSVTLQASVFTLQDIQRVQKWGILNIGASRWSLVSASEVYLDSNTGTITAPETLLPERKVRIMVQDSTDPTYRRQLYIFLNIVKRKYPTTIKIALDDVKVAEGKFQIGNTAPYTFYPKFYDENGEEQLFDGTIKSYKWSFTNESGMIKFSETKERPETGVDSVCKLVFSNLLAYVVYEQVSLEIEYVNGYKVSTTADLAIMESVPVLEDDDFGNSPLFRVVSNIRDENGNQLYKPEGTLYFTDTLAMFTGTFDLSDTSEVVWLNKINTMNFRTDGSKESNNIILFLTNISDLNLSNFPSLLELIFNDLRYSTGNDVETLIPESKGDGWAATWFKKVNISNTPTLKDLDPHPIKDLEEFYANSCTALTELNFSLNTKLKKVSMLDTTAKAILQFTDLTALDSLVLGRPTELKLKNLGSSEISLLIDGHNDLDTMVVENCSNEVAKWAIEMATLYDMKDENVAKNITGNKMILTLDYLDARTGYPESGNSTEDILMMPNLDMFHVSRWVKNLTLDGYKTKARYSTSWDQGAGYQPDIVNLLNLDIVKAAEILDYI